MSDLKDTIAELKAIITEIKTRADAGTNSYTGTQKADIEARIAHLNDKTKDHSKSPKELKLDMNDLDNLETLMGQDKTAWALEKTKLEKTKTDAESERDAKNTIIADKEKELKEQKEKVADKLTADLITKLETVANSTPADQTTKLTEIKTIIDELKTKGVKADLTDITKKVEDLATVASNIKDATEKLKTGETSGGKPYWAMGTCGISAVAVLLLGYVAFLKPNNNQGGNNYSSSEKSED